MTSDDLSAIPYGWFHLCCAFALIFIGCRHSPTSQFPDADGIYHVLPGDSIQQAINAAAQSKGAKRVVVHAGTYRPEVPAQALIYFNAIHDGITVEAEGQVVLTAANPSITDRSAASYPAAVNHVVYFGDGISRKTGITGEQFVFTDRCSPYSKSCS